MVEVINIYNKSELIITVYLDKHNSNASFVTHVKDRYKLPIYLYGLPGIKEHEPTFEWFEKFIKSRVFPRNRINSNDILVGLNLNKYDIWDIIKATNGYFGEDNYKLEWVQTKN